MGKFPLGFPATDATIPDSQNRVGAISNVGSLVTSRLPVAFSSGLASFIHFQNQELMFRKLPVYKRWNRLYVLLLLLSFSFFLPLLRYLSSVVLLLDTVPLPFSCDWIFFFTNSQSMFPVTPSRVPFPGCVFRVYCIAWWLSNQILSISICNS